MIVKHHVREIKFKSNNKNEEDLKHEEKNWITVTHRDKTMNDKSLSV